MSLISLLPFRQAGPSAQSASIEDWHVRISDPNGLNSLWIKFQTTVSRTGFTRRAEVSALLFQKQSPNAEAQKTSFRQLFDIREFRILESPQGPTIQIGNCEFSARLTRGEITTGGKKFSWNFEISEQEPQGQFNIIALKRPLPQFKWLEQRAVSPAENLVFQGSTSFNETTLEWKNALGMQGHWAGSRLLHSWVWAHCNQFTNDAGKPTPFLFEGLHGRGSGTLGRYLYPRLQSFYFHYQGKSYEFNSLWDSFRSRSNNTLNEWKFQADRGPLSFRGQMRGELKNFAGQSLEDTDGEPVYCSHTELGQLTLWVYRSGKLEETLHSRGGAAFQVALRKPNPYVPLLT